VRTGITQEQVNAAADAILSAGENPTVEKVRGELGTGSPNTITRMLDAWRTKLGERLRELSALPGLPSSVGQAMVELWRVAIDHAKREVEAHYRNERATFESARVELAHERESWETRLQATDAAIAQTQAARDRAEHACATLDNQLQDSHVLRADLVQQRDRLQGVSDHQALEIKELRGQLDEREAALRENRALQDTYLRAVEDRALQEIDRARQDSKQWRQRFEASERTHHAVVASIQAEHDILRDQLRKAEKDIARYTGIVSGLEKALTKTPPVSERRAKAKGIAVGSLETTSPRKNRRASGKATK
jgi:Plasmid replication region DNA-binding N-term